MKIREVGMLLIIDVKMVGEMKANTRENQAFSDAIDRLNSGMETIINLYNELEEDEPIITFDETVISAISKAKAIYGDEFVNQKINALVRETLSFLPPESSDKTESKKAKKG